MSRFETFTWLLQEDQEGYGFGVESLGTWTARAHREAERFGAAGGARPFRARGCTSSREVPPASSRSPKPRIPGTIH